MTLHATAPAPRTQFASVGQRVHTITSTGIVVTGGPQIGLCGTVFIPTTFEPDDDIPACRECHPLKIERTLLRMDILAESYDEKRAALNTELDNLAALDVTA